MPEKKILVTRSSMPDFEEYCEEIKPLWESHWITNRGIKHKELEESVQEYLGADYVTLFVNGHMALECVLETMELGRDGRNEVITTPFTFASTTHAIVRKGLTPVFADIKPDDCTLDPEKIEPLITEKTCAILPVHVYGNLCDVDAIEAIAEKYRLRVIYDAAHAFGVKKDGVSAAQFGDASMFSFHATKVFNTIEGGAICHANQFLCDRLAQWRNFGIVDEDHVEYPGGNAKLNEFAAAMGICNLRHVDKEIAKRKIVTERYWELLDGIPGISLYRPAANIKPNYAYMPVIFDSEVFGASRDKVLLALAEKGINARRYFYPLTSKFDCYNSNARTIEATPVAERISKQVLTLPMFADLKKEDVDQICEIIIRLR